MKRIMSILFVLLIAASGATAQVLEVLPGWEAIVIREASDGITGAPIIQDHDGIQTNSVEIAIIAGGQKAGLTTDALNGAMVSQITGLHIDRLDDVAASGSLYGPYFNIWITDGLGNYAVIANEPSNAEWAGSMWDVANWNFLKTKTCKVYETIDAAAGTSWVHAHALLNGWSGVLTELTFEHVGGLVVSPPSAAYILAGNGIGSGAPDELGTNIARGYTWVFGDTANNYISGGDGFVVNNYTAVATLSVQNTTQGTSYATIEAALAVAVANDVIIIADGTYNPPSTLYINTPLTFSGASEAGVIINVPAAGGYAMSIQASDVLMENFTLVTNVANENFPIKASGTTNPPNGFDNLTMRYITVSGVHRRTGFDVHGYNNVIMSNLTSSDATGGNGAQITGCVGVTVDNVTTTNNAWGSFAIYSSSTSYLSRGSSNVNIDGASCSFGEFNLFNQDEFGFFNTDITVTGYGYMVRNYNYRVGADGYTHYQISEADAIAFAAGLDGIVPGSFITTIGGGTHVVVAGMGIKFALDGASNGDVINIGSGTYVESGQLVVDKDISLIGDVGGRPIVMTDANTGTSGDAKGWFLQSAGTHLILRNLELDGIGFDVNQAIRSAGSGELDNCALRNIVAPGYQGMGLVAFGAAPSNWDVTGCSFDDIGRLGFLAFGTGLTNSSFIGNTYTGKGPGDWLDYACDISAGTVITVEDNIITACEGVASSDGSTSAGLLVSTYFAPGTTAVINNNIITGNTFGIAVGYDTADVSVVTGYGNDFSGNASYGVFNESLTNPVNFLGNWWGSATGPNNATSNPAGTGVPVGDMILFDPWVGMAAGDIVPAANGPLNCGQTITLTFNYTADGSTPDMFLYNAVVSSDVGLEFGTILDLEPFGVVNNNFFAMQTGTNQWTITGSTVGNPTYPVSGAGTTGLFEITFSATGDVVGNVSFDSLTLRDPSNATIPVALTSAAITYDCTDPIAVTGITAAPRHNRVDVNWTPGVGTDTATYEIYRGLWYDTVVNASAYPEYDDLAGDVIPARPISHVDAASNSEWEYAGSVAFGVNSFTDIGAVVSGASAFDTNGVDRGVYYYEVFVVDTAGNSSAPAAANDRATNYWLGDVAGPVPSPIPDGVVTSNDINTLGTFFGISGAAITSLSNALDVGPTDDWSRVGIPLTDSAINFEDLMIFSMNFGVVTAAKIEIPLTTKIDLAWVTYGDGSMALRLEKGSGLKGIRVRADKLVAEVVAGGLLDAQSEMTFLKNVGEKLDVSISVMGTNKTFQDNGDLFVVRAASQINMEDLEITLRGVDNKELKFSMDRASGTLLPQVFSLAANYPNPFNPMTKISFSLPEAQAVKLAIYSIDGRRVATLLNEPRGAGMHEVLWMGQNDAGQTVSSGLYFYRIDAGPYSQVRKMTLMK